MYGSDSETLLMKLEHKMKLNLTEISMIRWMCGIKLNERKKSEELIGLEPISLMIKKSRLRWFVHGGCKNDNDWVKHCMMWEVEEIRQRRCPKIWWDYVKDDMESLGLPQRDVQFRNKWRRRI